MNPTFLEKLAIKILDKHPNSIHKLCFVFPSKRSGLFFKKELAKRKKGAFWAPQILTIEEFVSHLSGITIIGSLEQVFYLFQVHQNLDIQPQLPFEKFIEQGKVILGDFNDIDMALADVNALFNNVNDFVHLENWDPSDPKKNTLSQKYIDSYKNLPRYYFAYKAMLLKQNKAYQGLVYRYLNDQNSNGISTDILKKLQAWDMVYVAGLNALTPAETWFFDALKLQKKLRIYYEAELQMVTDLDQESGKFMREFQKKEGKGFKWVSDQLTGAKKNIDTYAVNGNLAIARMVGELFSHNQNNVIESETAIILADENLLMPVLESIPPSVKNVNVTLGFPLGLTPFMSVVEQLFGMHQLAKKWDGKKKFYFKDVFKLLSNPILVYVFGNSKELSEITKKWVEKNQVWINADDLMLEMTQTKNCVILAQAFTNWKETPLESIQFFKLLIDSYQNQIDQQQAADDVLLEQLYFFKTSLTTLQTYIDQFNYVLSLEAIKQIFKQVVAPLNVPFSGEPLAGVQIMGLLETRLLRFKNIIFLSVNEGVIPAKAGFQSFLPFVLRSGFGIQTYQERESLFAYHFYRVLSQAENIKLVYNTSTEGVNANEKSRFIRQIEQEWPPKSAGITFKHHIGVFTSELARENAVIKKTPQVIANIKTYLTTRGLSPSALNTYIESPIDFYYKNVLRIREPQAVDEDMEHNTFGTIVHACLELFYKPFEKRVLQPKELQEAFNTKIEAIVEQEFSRVIPDHSRGKHYIYFFSVSNYVKKFILDNITLLQKNTAPVTLVKNELELRGSFNVNGIEVRFLGFADRVEKSQGVMYISDYKTGKVKQIDLSADAIEDLYTIKHKPKLLQLLMYAWMAHKVLGEEKIVSGIYSLRTIKQVLLPATIHKGTILEQSHFNEIESFIEDKIMEMLNPDIDLEVNSEYQFSLF